MSSLLWIEDRRECLRALFSLFEASKASGAREPWRSVPFIPGLASTSFGTREASGS